jgi:hypothetical protein
MMMADLWLSVQQAQPDDRSFVLDGYREWPIVLLIFWISCQVVSGFHRRQ